MLEMVEARRNTNKVEQRHDLFSGLLDAAQEDLGSEKVLSDEALIGGFSASRFLKSAPSIFSANMFIFLVAGHAVRSSHSSCVFSSNNFLQTTAHALCFSFGLLALYPDEQERLYQHIKSVMSSLNGIPVGSGLGSGNLSSYREPTFP